MQTATVQELARAGAVADVEWLDAPAVLREAFPQRTTGCVPRVPYALLADAKARAITQYPDASRIVALWTPTSSNEVCVEVWAHGRAQVIPADAIGKVIL